MKNYIAIAILILFSIFLVNALDSETALVCGGDNETVILCLSSETLNFFGYNVPEIGVGGGTPETIVPIPPIVLEPFLLFGIVDISFLRRIGLGSEDLLLIYGLLFIFILCLFSWLRKRKCNKCKKKFKQKDLTKYKGKYYCDKCLEEIRK